MSKDDVNYLAKIFKEKEYLEDFLDGKLYMNCLGFFKKVEGSSSNQFDNKEAIKSYLQPNGVKLELIFNDKSISLNEANLSAPILLQYSIFNNLKIICFYTFSGESNDFNQGAKDAKISPKIVNDFGNDLVLITNTGEFINRVKKALNKREEIIRYEGRKVDYFPEDFHGDFADKDIPFKKHIDFIYQNEFRIVLETIDHDDNPLILQVGDLRDICRCYSVEEFNNANYKLPSKIAPAT